MTKVGDSIEAGNARWTFQGPVSEKLDEHLERSVPFYQQGHELVARVSDFFLQDGSLVYDLGCATGALTACLAKHNAGKGVRIVGVESEPDMIEKARARCAGLAGVEIVQGDVVDLDMAGADLVVSYYTIQFVRPRHRQDVFDLIYKALNWGGGFVLFEKVRAPDARFQDIATALYADYKLERGYSEAEIVQKQRSLKGVLEPFSTQGNLDLLKRAGFVDVMTIFKYVCFEGFLAIK